MRTPLIQNGQPGDFRAVCAQSRWYPVADVHLLPEEERPAPDAYTRWDRALRCEVVEVRCSLDTTDREVYLAHMATNHNKRPRGPRMLTRRNAINRPTRLPEEGRPFKPSTRSAVDKRIAEMLKTCDTCGLVAELNGTHEDDMWWKDHERGCYWMSEINPQQDWSTTEIL